MLKKELAAFERSVAAAAAMKVLVDETFQTTTACPHAQCSLAQGT